MTWRLISYEPYRHEHAVVGNALGRRLHDAHDPPPADAVGARPSTGKDAFEEVVDLGQQRLLGLDDRDCRAAVNNQGLVLQERASNFRQRWEADAFVVDTHRIAQVKVVA